MRLRSNRLAAVGAVVVLIFGGASLLPVPYVLLSPGPTADTLSQVDGKPLIRVEGHPTYPTEGKLELTTVRVAGDPQKGLDLLSALYGWVSPRSAVVPQELVYPRGATEQQVQQRNAEDMTISQQEATTAALRELHVPVAAVLVKSVLENAPALNKLKAGDEILSIDGKPIPTAQAVRDAVTAHRPGEEVVIRVRRAGKELEQRIRTGEANAPDGGRRAVIGIVPAEKFPFQVEISLENIGGPSAGLMFALGIVDKLTPGPLTGGSVIAGTGTIDDEGHVGPIGGIQQKLVAARGAGATVFLTPEANCRDAAAAVPDGLRLVKVATLDQAVGALDRLRTGSADVPSCAG